MCVILIITDFVSNKNKPVNHNEGYKMKYCQNHKKSLRQQFDIRIFSDIQHQSIATYSVRTLDKRFGQGNSS